jgi:fucose permease
MKVEHAHLNLIFAWLWILLGFISGMTLGMFFHRENWLGGYGSFKRRMYRLGHISFFGLGAVNLLFWLTMQKIPSLESLAGVASWAFIIGGVTMPLCCAVVAHFPKAHLIFAVPVLCLVAGGVLMLAILVQEPSSAAGVEAAINHQPSAPNSP